MKRSKDGSKKERKRRVGRPLKATYVPASGETFGHRLGAVLRRRRMQLGMTLEDVSIATGNTISIALLAAYEKGSEPSISRYILLCVALGASLTSLLPDDLRRVLQREMDAVRGVDGSRADGRPAAQERHATGDEGGPGQVRANILRAVGVRRSPPAPPSPSAINQESGDSTNDLNGETYVQCQENAAEG